MVREDGQGGHESNFILLLYYNVSLVQYSLKLNRDHGSLHQVLNIGGKLTGKWCWYGP